MTVRLRFQPCLFRFAGIFTSCGVFLYPNRWVRKLNEVFKLDFQRPLIVIYDTLKMILFQGLNYTIIQGEKRKSIFYYKILLCCYKVDFYVSAITTNNKIKTIGYGTDLRP